MDGLLTLSVLGPGGMVDLVVPEEAAAADVAAEYARLTGVSGLSGALAVRRGLGDPLPPGASLRAADVAAGEVLVTQMLGEPGSEQVAEPAARVAPSGRALPDAGGVWWVATAVAAAVVSGWYAARASGDAGSVVVTVLLLAAAVGVLPGGRLAHARGVAAPAFAAVAAYASAWRPDAASLPVTLGVSGLAAAATAAAARAVLPDEPPAPGFGAAGIPRRYDEPHLAWMVAGTLLFAVASLVAVVGLPPSLAWSVLLVAAMLAARAVPALAVDVPDQLLVDLERLAVTAWSARDQPRGKRGRTVVTAQSVAGLALRGQRIVTAASLAIAVVTPLSGYLLLAPDDAAALDRLGATLLVGFVAASLLLVANSYRNLRARLLLRVGGVLSGLVIVVLEVPAWTAYAGWWLVAGGVVLGGGCVTTAVAIGRGWRSVWWARRAEIAESVSGALALAAVCLSTGLFRLVWEQSSRFAL